MLISFSYILESEHCKPSNSGSVLPGWTRWVHIPVFSNSFRMGCQFRNMEEFNNYEFNFIKCICWL